MKNKMVNWLQIKVFMGLGLLLLGSATTVIYLDLIAQENHANQQVLGYVKQLKVQGEAIQRRGITYSKNAPRDYAPYNRDVIIFYPDFISDLDAFENQINNIARMVNNMPRNITSTSNNSITESIHNLQTRWQGFKKGFLEKLGPDTKEPRLEWGAEYVEQNQELINAITGKLITTIDQAIQGKLEANRQLSTISIASAGTLLVFGVIWFYFSVIRRITLTVKGCQRVAQGDFGYQLPVKTNDELGSLARAFNTLSARTRFVLTMLSKMHREGNAETKIDALYKEAAGYLPIDWIALWSVDQTNGKLHLMSMRSDKKIRSSMQTSMKLASSNDAHLLTVCRSRNPVKYDNLIEISSTTPNAKLVREIIKIGLLKSALLVPLTSDDGWQGLIMFVAHDAAAYTDEQVELMGNLAPFMANGFTQSEKKSSLQERILSTQN